LVVAQFNSFKAGSYILDKSRQTRHDAQLKLKSDKLLVAKDANGETLKLTPKDIYSFRIEQQRYRTASGFEIKSGFSGEIIDEVFVTLLDSGQVLLMRYDYISGSAMRVGAGGAMMGGGGFPQEVYLIRGAKSYSTPAVISGGNSAKAKAALQATLSPYVAQRPDLAKLLADGQIYEGNLFAFIRALNTGLSFK
jgi:hypothetical protein